MWCTRAVGAGPAFGSLAALVCLGGCSREDDASAPSEKPAAAQAATQPFPQAAAAEPAAPAKPATRTKPADDRIIIHDISDNPAFYTVTAVDPAGTAAKQMDELIRPVLVGVFGDAKFVSETETPRYTENLTNGAVKYVVRQMLAEDGGQRLRDALKEAHFNHSGRIGSKPYHDRRRGLILTCVTKRIAGAVHNVFFVMDLQQQAIYAYLIPFDVNRDRY